MLKTLHWYIARELGRVFFLTTSVLTTILAFGGTFRPLTKQGLSLVQLLQVLLDLIPAMLAYSIPLAALFAAVIVYWRLATDNELTGARASGVSYAFLVTPALVLGLVVGGIDLLFVGYVVPAFLQKTSQVVVQTDLASMLLHDVGQHQPFQFGNMVVYADNAYPIPSPANTPAPAGVKQTVIQLRGLAATPLIKDKPSAIVLARAANVIIDRLKDRNQMRVGVQLKDGVAYAPKSFRQIRGTIRYLPPDGKPYVIGSLLVNRPKFLGFHRLVELRRDPFRYDPIAALERKFNRDLRMESIAEWYMRRFQAGVPMTFSRPGGAVEIRSPAARLSVNKRLIFLGNVHRPVRVAVIRHGRATMLYKAPRAELLPSLAAGAKGPNSKAPDASLRLTGGALRELNPRLNHRFHAGPPVVFLSSLQITPAAVHHPSAPARGDESPEMAGLLKSIHGRVDRLRRQIDSEMQSRQSFAFSCVVLVILGAALGIILRDRNPLAVFVVGFVPAMVLVLLINTGREMITRTTGSDLPGLTLIWAGNGLILALNFLVYSRLLRR